MKKYEHGGNIYDKKIKYDFSVNTNPLGISDNVLKAVSDASASFALYPDSNTRELRESISKYEGVSEKNVVCSNGASEMIFAVVRAVKPKRALLIAPCFSEYERALLAFGCEIVYYDTSEENGFRINDDILDYTDNADMVFICNPNNPTGVIADKIILESIAKKNIVCVVDECFTDLSDSYSMKGRLPVIKAFTKTFSMAGLRLGYLIADTEFCRSVKEQLPMWNVNAAATAAALAALRDKEYLKKSLELITSERAYMTDKMRGLGFKVFSSEANFILVKGAEGLGKKLAERGILIRECDNFRAIDGYFYRIAIRKREENDVLLRELGDIIG